MEIVSKQVKIKKSLLNNEIEKELSCYGELLRWAVVEVLQDEYLVEAVFIR